MFFTNKDRYNQQIYNIKTKTALQPVDSTLQNFPLQPEYQLFKKSYSHIKRPNTNNKNTYKKKETPILPINNIFNFNISNRISQPINFSNINSHR